ncbi:MAG: hypothetical protein MJ245_01670 [Clostridia bacterium]|nr:hypothetical protein [Clostridia bacterium]
MKSSYNELLLEKYGLDDEAIEIVSELKKRIRKISPLTKEQKDACEVCGESSQKEPVYNHHIMKVEYLAILAYCYDLYKKEKNPNYVEHRGMSEEEKNTQSEKEYIYVLRKDKELYIPRIGICERHHNMIHELAEDFEGTTNKGLLNKAKPRELKELYDIFTREDMGIYKNIFDKDETLEGREYYISYLKIWNDTLDTAYKNLDKQVTFRLSDKYPDELSKKNRDLLKVLKENIDNSIRITEDALEYLNPEFSLEGEDKGSIEEFDVIPTKEDEKEIKEEKELDKNNNVQVELLLDDEDLSSFSIDQLESMKEALDELTVIDNASNEKANEEDEEAK